MLAKDCKYAWCPELAKPFFAPPCWVFGIVWPILYILLAVSAWMVWERRDKVNVTNTMVLFGTHMFLNLAWSPLYFCTKSVLLGLVMTLLVLYLAVVNYMQFRRIEPMSALLMVPYLVWISYAVLLCAGYVVLNVDCHCLSGLAEMIAANPAC